MTISISRNRVAANDAAMADEERRIRRNRADAHLRGERRGLQNLQKIAEQRAPFRGHDAAAGNQHRALRLRQHVGGAGDLGSGGSRAFDGAIGRWRQRKRRVVEIELGRKYVLRHIEMNRAAPPGQRLAEGVADEIGQPSPVMHNRAPFGQRLQERMRVEIHEHAAVGIGARMVIV